MLERLRTSKDKNDHGFTLIELLVVMIIIGILAVIAIPVFLTQRQKARDTATKSYVTKLGKELAGYYLDGTAAITAVTITGTAASVMAGTVVLATTQVSPGTAMQAVAYTQLTPIESTWCVAMTDASGSALKDWSYSAAGGLAAGACP